MRLVYSCGASPEQPDMHPLHWRSTCQNRVSARSIAGVLKGDFCPFRGVRRPVIGDASNVRFCLKEEEKGSGQNLYSTTHAISP